MTAWTREAMEKLIRLYKNHPCLYNSHLREYRDQTVKKRTWELIKNNLQDVRHGVTAEQVKNKISSMRGQLSAEYAKLRYNVNYEPKIWFFNHLEFLKEFTRNASAERNTPTPNRMNESFDESSRDSTPSRNSISSPTSFFDTRSMIQNSPVLERMRTGISSPAPSLYGEEAEPFVEGAARGLPESKSFELSAIADDIPTMSKYTTASEVNSSIFDQPTLGSVHVPSFSSPNMSPIINRDNQPVNENASVFRVPVSSTPVIRQASQENVAGDTGDSSRIFSPPRRLILNEDDVKNTYEIIVVSDSESSLVAAPPEPLNIKRELAYEMHTQTDENVMGSGNNIEEPQPVRLSSCEVAVQTEENLPELAPKNVCETSVQTEETLPQPVLREVCEIAVQTEGELGNDVRDNDEHRCVRKSVSEVTTQTENHPNEEESEEAEEKSSDVKIAVPLREVFVQTDDQIPDEPKAGSSSMESRSVNDTFTPGNLLHNKRKFSPAKKEMPTKFEDSDSEYFSADESTPPSSPAPKKVKVVHVTAGTKLPNFFMPIREMNEDFAFGNLVALKLKPLAPEQKTEVQTKILSAFTPKKKLLNFWPF